MTSGRCWTRSWASSPIAWINRWIKSARRSGTCYSVYVMSRPTWARWVTRISLVVAIVALVVTVYTTGLATIGSYFKRIGRWWFAVVALAIAALFFPMRGWLRVVMFGAGVVCAVLAIGLYVLVHKGVLASLARVARKIYIPGLATVRRKIWKKEHPSPYLLSAETAESLHDSLTAVDNKVRVSEGARTRDRITGIVAVTLSRLVSLSLSLLILHAVGEGITMKIVAGYTDGGFIVYMVATLVLLGLGVSEGGIYWLFRALGENPARGVTLTIARRVTVVLYAAIGLVLMAASETVARAREGITSAEPLPAGQAPAAAALPPARVIDRVIDAAD